MSSVLGYWNIAGLAAPIRLLLNYVGEDFTERLYETGPGPEFSREEWLKEKFHLGLNYPNLPYYKSGDAKLVQSVAIMRYLARKHDLGPNSEAEAQMIDVVEQETQDLLMNLAIIAYNPDFENLKHKYLEKLPEKLKLHSEFLEDKPWVVGDRITYVDFLLYHSLDYQRILKPDCLDSFPNLKDYVDHFEALPANKRFMESDRHIRLPFHLPFAYFANTKDYKTTL